MSWAWPTRAGDRDVGAAGAYGEVAAGRQRDPDVEPVVAAEEAAALLGPDDGDLVAVLLDGDLVGVAAGDGDVGLGGLGRARP